MDDIAIQPDEWLAGYLGRIAAINSWHTAFALQQGIQRSAKPSMHFKSNRPNYFELIASSLQTELETLLHEHTLWRLHRAFRSKDQIMRDGAEVIPSKHIGYVAQQYRRNIWFCPVCAVEDRKRIMFSYWRQSHQVPGTIQCALHPADLIGVPHKGILNFTPDRFIDDPMQARLAIPIGNGREWLDATVKILHQILRSQETPDQATVLGHLQKFCGLEECSDKRGRYAEIAEDIRSNFPHSWLTDFMPLVKSFDGSYSFLVSVLQPNLKVQSRLPATHVALLTARYVPSDLWEPLLTTKGASLLN